MSLSWTLQKVALHYFFVLGVNVGNEQYFVASQNFPFIPLSTLYQDSESFDSLGLGIWGGGVIKNGLEPGDFRIMRAGDEFEKLE